ncbi:protein cornichon homolog 1 isoform X1 [Amaranthus tricolor]|uniref:protein cornichon homolog 1 isoform X1 n=1 Tax=Amaranthus tricolor TaxID=29722 RepID=UPI00258BBBBC|nr:protein cornichon homolog 1 isoform X1 [Amaranthus tricolor]XP_057547869.1 protein cornichon homolog 1 isoform X1 [Amaranthus tricolor]
MQWDLILWLIALFSNIGLLVILIYQIICLSDLEADYLNPYESSTNINSMVLPEFGLQAAFCALFLFTGHWFMFLITLPVTIFHARLFTRQEHLVDVTEIFRALSSEKKHRFIKLGLYLLYFFLVVLRFPAGSISSLPIFSSKHGDLDIRTPILEF